MFEKSTDQLAADVEKWAVKELSLMHQQRDAAAKVLALELNAGDALLDAEGDQPSTAPMDAVARARSEAAAVTAAIASCRLRRVQAITAKRAAAASELRREVMTLRRQRDALEKKTASLMDALGELQGMPYSASPTPTAPGIPLSQLLLNKIQAAESQASALECELPRSGEVSVEDVTGVEALVAAVLRVEVDVPNTPSILEWAASVELRSGRLFGDHPRRFHLVWNDGLIDPGESYIQIPGLVKATTGTLGGAVRELGTDQFRAAVA
jgi:hypothetical protein